ASLDRISKLLPTSSKQGWRWQNLRSPLSITLAVGFLSSLLTINNWVFHKPYYPDRIAGQMMLDRTVPLVMVVGYENLQEAALGLSFALELQKRHRTPEPDIEPGMAHSPSQPPPNVKFAFLDRSTGYDAVWQSLSQLQPLPEPPFNLWVVGPGLQQAAYPASIAIVSSDSQCDRDLDRYYRLGIPYQLYRCRLRKTSQSRIEKVRADL
ncbi:hypothetical protein IQ235_10525, partial [Oscillatoriales cyanobacterium LEGE 11467]|nr:hypothetical protein [Zarconia navalis LEGE 11467]